MWSLSICYLCASAALSLCLMVTAGCQPSNSIVVLPCTPAGPRLAEARAAGTSAGEGAPSSEEADLCERNLRLQLTQWGAGQGVEGDSEIHDYANKEWAGLVGGYYR